MRAFEYNITPCAPKLVFRDFLCVRVIPTKVAEGIRGVYETDPGYKAADNLFGRCLFLLQKEIICRPNAFAANREKVL